MVCYYCILFRIVFRETEKRLKESQEKFKQETERLKKVLQDLKVPSCDNPISVFCAESEKLDGVKPGSSQKSILKQPSSTKKQSFTENDVICPNLKKTLSICSKTNLKGSDQKNINRDTDSKGKITVSTAVYLSDNENPSCSNVTSTYYNKDFLKNSQSEKEMIVPKPNMKDVSVCTLTNCPIKSKK